MKSYIVIVIICALLVTGASAEELSNPKVVLETNFGDIVIELFPDDAPMTVENFLDYVNSGFYNGLLFHRVIENFMIQGGGFDTNLNQRTPNDPIINESYNGLKNVRGTIAMARTTDPNSANSQFFINHVNNPFLDRENAEDGYGYCVFGEVISDMNVVDAIAATPTEDWGGAFQNLPVNPPVIIYKARMCLYVSPTGSDTTGTGGPQHPLATIQKAVDEIDENGYVILMDGTYSGAGNRDIDPQGKALTITSWRPYEGYNIHSTIIDAGGSSGDPHRAFYFDSNEQPTTLVQGVIITNGYADKGGAVYCKDSRPRFLNCIIQNSTADYGGAIYCENASPYIIATNILNNIATVAGGGLYGIKSNPAISNSIVRGNGSRQLAFENSWPTILFNNIQGGYPGAGNIDEDPHFFNAAGNDYHLKSEGFRYDIVSGQFVQAADTVTSRCIDAGNPSISFSNELTADGYQNNRINMGVYANTNNASIAAVGWALKSDVNNDGIVDFKDFAWLTTIAGSSYEYYYGDFDENQLVDIYDIAKILNNWLGDCGSPDFCNGCDLDRNGTVDFEDLAVVSSNFGESLPYKYWLPWADINNDNQPGNQDLDFIATQWLSVTLWNGGSAE